MGMDSMFMLRLSPMRMTEPLPNCFSIWPSAASSAFSRSFSAIPLSSVSVLCLCLRLCASTDCVVCRPCSVPLW